MFVALRLVDDMVLGVVGGDACESEGAASDVCAESREFWEKERRLGLEQFLLGSGKKIAPLT